MKIFPINNFLTTPREPFSLQPKQANKKKNSPKTLQDFMRAYHKHEVINDIYGTKVIPDRNVKARKFYAYMDELGCLQVTNDYLYFRWSPEKQKFVTGGGCALWGAGPNLKCYPLSPRRRKSQRSRLYY
jgi:hypothetical protein